MQEQFIREIILNSALSMFIFLLYIDCVKDVRFSGKGLGAHFPKWLLTNTFYYLAIVATNVILLVDAPELFYRVSFSMEILLKELSFVPFSLWVLDMIQERVKLPEYTNRVLATALTVTAAFLAIWILFYGGNIYNLSNHKTGFVLYVCMYLRTLAVSALLILLILFSYKAFRGGEMFFLILYSAFPSIAIPIPSVAGIDIDSIFYVLILLVVYARIWHSRRKHYEEYMIELEKSKAELAEAKLNLIRTEKAADDSQVKIMISQIQPHFIYNALSSISALCILNPEKAQELTEEFSKYLRSNLSSINADTLVGFDRELEHTKFYLDVELTRFPDRLRVSYDIKAKNFALPILTLQPLVENAVARGICEKLDGGTVKIMTDEDERGYYIYINNDGSGFDSAIDENSDMGLAIGNVRNRLELLVNGTLTIEGSVNGGTDVTIFVPKRG